MSQTQRFKGYDSIVVKREGYGPIGKGGNGLIPNSALALNPLNGQPIGLLWQKLWNPWAEAEATSWRDPNCQKKTAKSSTKSSTGFVPFEEKESYRWIEALQNVEKKVSPSTHIIHVFDREGDMAEVFDSVRQLKQTGVLVRAAHNRSLDPDKLLYI